MCYHYWCNLMWIVSDIERRVDTKVCVCIDYSNMFTDKCWFCSWCKNILKFLCMKMVNTYVLLAIWLCPMLLVCGHCSYKFWLISYQVRVGSEKCRWIPDSAEDVLRFNKHIYHKFCKTYGDGWLWISVNEGASCVWSLFWVN